MFNHQYNFNIEIPKELISQEKHNKIFYELLENKVIIGCAGYARSGKDTIANKFIDKYGYHRIAFADNVKIDMNNYLKKSVYNYLLNVSNLPIENKKDIEDGLLLEDGRVLTLDMIDFQTKDIQIKTRLRPFIIWFGEIIREINGEYFWVNKAFKEDASGHNNIIISDIRRVKELDVFMNSNWFKKRSDISFLSSKYTGGSLNIMAKNYSSLLFHVSQFKLIDKDSLTVECIRFAQENWIFDHTFYIDSRLPENGPYRNNSINLQIKEVVKKFGIKKIDETIAVGRQMSILD
jgi:hypothetical protein